MVSAVDFEPDTGWLCLGFLLKLFDSAVTMKSSNRFHISVFALVGFIFMFYLFGWVS